MFSGSFFCKKALLRTCLIGLLLAAPLYVNAGNNNYVYVYNNILNTTGNGSGIACMSCHTGTDPLGCYAPTTWAMSNYADAASHADRMYIRTAPGAGTYNMPMATNCTYNDAAVISTANRTILNNWYNAGSPNADATATTNAISSQQKTQVTLNGTVNTNTTNPLAVSGKDGQWYFQWGTGTGSTYTSTIGTTTRNSISSGAVSTTLTGLACGSSYHYRVVAKNGDSTTYGSQVNFTTLACTNPVITEGATISPAATNEDTQTTFTLNRTDDDPGTLTWSVQTQGSKGTFSFDTSVTGSPVTVRYTPLSNQNGSDTAGVIKVTNATTGLTDTIAVTMTINAVNDPPVVNASGTVLYTEGDPATTVDSGLTVSDVDGDQIKGATVTITNYAAADGEVLACTGTLGSGNLTGITGCTPGSGTLTLTGTTTTSNYQNALRTVTYYNPSANPTVGDRTVQFVVQDNSGAGNDTSTGSNVTVSVSAVSTPPTITGFSGTTAFTEQTPVIVDSSVTITDPDSTLLNRARMTLTTNYDAADSLVCPTSGLPSGISCSYTAPTLTLSSATANSLVNYETAIALVQFNNTADNPTSGNRTVTLTVRDDSNTVSSVVSKAISIAQVNDPPTITSTAPSAATKLITENVASNVYQVTQSDPDDSSFTYSLTSAPSGMAISSTGLVIWTPPRTGVFDKATANITVKVTDTNSTGASNGVQSTTQTFNLATSPPDSDGDGVADYSDNCPSVANASQADMDGDTVHTLPQTDPSGIPTDGDVDPAAKDANGFLTGGDACDEDTDGDGMPNTYENLYSFLNPLDPTDAAKDYDGDGITNLAEYRAGTPPDLDNVPPVVVAPAAVTVNSTGYLTDVDLGFASAIDGNDGSISSIVPIIDATISLCTELSNYPLVVPPFRPGLHVANWSTCDSAGNISYAAQDVRVRPILSAGPGQTVGAGQTTTVAFVLNGPAADYPVSVHYQLGGTASSNDYDISSGTLTISQTDVDSNNPGLIGKLNITIANTIAQDETLTIALSNAVNAVLGPSNSTQVDIVNHDTTPVLSTAITQNGIATGRTIYPGSGVVVLTVNTSDTNTATAPVFDWSATDNAISGIGSIANATNSSSMSFDPSGLVAGLYPVVVTVSDAGQTSTTRFTLNVVASIPDLTDCNLDGVADVPANTDCDGDGIDNATEGAIDSNGNGIPDYLDDNRIVDRSVLQNETGNPTNTYLLMTDPGLQLRLGTTALASGNAGALVSQQNINQHGGPNGSAGTNPQDSDSNDGGFYDFEVTGLNDSITSAHIVIPLQSAILDNAVYRNYNGSAWSSFVIDANNTISSAPGNNGVCPAPGSIEYTLGLTPLNTCVELTIEDGGPNDADGVRDYVIRDPGGVGIPPAVVTPAPDKSKGGAGVLHPAVLLLMLAVFSLLAPRRKDRS